MKKTKGLLDSIKQFNKLTIKISSNTNNFLPTDTLKKYFNLNAISFLKFYK